MANPFDIPEPTDMDLRNWAIAEQFANDAYQDLEGNWIDAFFGNSGFGGALARVLHGSWDTLTTPEERWAFAAKGRMESLTDRNTADKLAKWLVSIVTMRALDGAGKGGGLPDRSDDQVSIPSAGSGGGTAQLAGTLASLSGSALNSLTDVGVRSTSILSEIAAGVLGSIEDRNRDSSNLIADLFRRSSGNIDELLRKGGSVIDVLTGAATGAIEDLLRDTLGKNSDVLGRVGDVLNEHIGRATDNNTTVSRAIERSLEAEVDQARRNSDAIEHGLGDAIERISGTADSAINTVGDALGETGRAQVQATQEGSALIGRLLGTQLQGIAGPIARLVGDEEATTPKATGDRIKGAFDAVMKAGDCPEDFGDFVHKFIAELTSAWNPTTALVHIMAEVQLMQSIFGPALQVLGNCMAQAAARAAPTALHGVPDVKDMLRRGVISKERAAEDLLSQGYNVDRTAEILATRNELPDVGFVQTWFLRGFIDAKTAIEKLAHKGYSGSDIENLLKMAFFIPPPADLITMAVRDVFSPAIAQRFGQYEDFPKAFEEYASQQGISKEWAERYWAAHWSLPSPQQGFEMYQRDVIERKDLELLLKALDIMPFWRDKLTQIAFRPVTRVDIRRMHQLGLLSTPDMTKRYRHMGYSPEDAAFMSKFTERLNDPKGEWNVEELEGATRSTALQLFERGAITKAQAAALLKDMGTGERAINVLLTNLSMKMEMKRRDEETDLILEQAKAALIDTDEASDKLARLGLQPVELAMARTKLKRTETQLTKIPSKADLDKMYTHDLLSDLEYSLALRKQGYSLYWIERLLKLAKAEQRKKA